MKSLLILSAILIVVCSTASAQLLNIQYGSNFESVSPFEAFGFQDSSGTAFSSDLNPGLLAVGWSDGFAGNTTFQEYLDDFNMLGTVTFGVSGNQGFLNAQASNVSTAGIVGETPYILTLKGVTNYSNASSATEFGIYNATSWGTIPAGGSPVATFYDTRSIFASDVDNVITGSLAVGAGPSGGGAFRTTAVPEPSSGLLAILGVSSFLFFRRRRS